MYYVVLANTNLFSQTFDEMSFDFAAVIATKQIPLEFLKFCRPILLSFISSSLAFMNYVRKDLKHLCKTCVRKKKKRGRNRGLTSHFQNLAV